MGALSAALSNNSRRAAASSAAAVGPLSPDQNRKEREYLAKSFALAAALEDALFHLSQVYGVDYLDVFLERRIRASVDDLTKAWSAVPTEDAEADDLRRELIAEFAADAEGCLVEAVSNVLAYRTGTE